MILLHHRGFNIIISLCISIFFLPILVQSRPYVIFIENIIMAVSGHCVEYLRKSKKKWKW